MIPARKQPAATAYRVLELDTVADYIAACPDLAARLGGDASRWRVREVGDGNLNLVFIVEGPAGSLCLKQALPYVRLVGESWPLTLTRAHYEHAALSEHIQYAVPYMPALYHHDVEMALTAMEYLSPHIILRKGFVRGIEYPAVARHLGEFMAAVLYHTSDLHLPAEVKKERVAAFAGNTAMCKITEDLVFDEPYFDAPMNRHTAGLDDIAEAFRQDTPLKNAAQEMKWKFLNHAEALLHGDLHTGSVMVTADDTRVIDPEFAFYGPMGFDIGMLIANFLLAYYAQTGLAEKPGARDAYAAWILGQIPVLWDAFAASFAAFWRARDASNPGGAVYPPRVGGNDDTAIRKRLDAIWKDTLGFAGVEMIRRILGLAHVEDMESIADPEHRAACERRALEFARMLLLSRGACSSVSRLVENVAP